MRLLPLWEGVPGTVWAGFGEFGSEAEGVKSNLMFLAGLLGFFLLVAGALAVDFWIWRGQHPGAAAWSWLFHH